MDNLPEGLHLTSGRFEDTRISDAQDLTWVTFSTGGRGDPPDWLATIISRTCASLGITTAFFETDEMSVDAFIAKYTDGRRATRLRSGGSRCD